jgi:23S rRNA (guanosine2251-2'-O)-methyltransferase
MRKLANQELKRISTTEYKLAPKIPLFIVLDNIRSLNNIGSIFRTADAFRVSEILLCGITGQPPHREIHKTALGATESVDWRYFENTIDAIRYLIDSGVLTVAVEQVDTSIPLHDFQPQTEYPLALVFGNEINGVSDEILPLMDACIEIPQFGTKHSFNVAVSAGIVIYDITHKLKA